MIIRSSLAAPLLLALITLWPSFAEARTNDFASATTLTGVSASDTGSTVGATGETGEPTHSGVTNSIWWKWTAPSAGRATISLVGSNYDTYLAVYTGSAVNMLTLIGFDDDNGGGAASRLTFTAVSGTTYRIAVDGFSSDTGSVVINLTHTPAPTVTNVTPNSGSTAGGTSVTITGTGFTGATAVTFGGTAATIGTVTATSITATTPARAAGTASVLVTTPGGTNAANTLFTYLVPNATPTDITLSPTNIAENNAAGATVGTLTATDTDAGQTHTFTLVAGNGTNDVDNGSFTISGSSLRLTPVADFETKASYALRVRATDNGAGNLSYDKSLVVTITNINEAPTLTVTNAVVSANEGSTITNSGTFADLDSSTITLSASVGSVSATAPAVLRSDLATGAAWRRPAVTKPLDADSNNVYGTDGYAMWGLGGTITNVAPSYATVTKLAAAYYGGNPGYTSIDNPADPDGAKVVTGINYAQPGISNPQNFFRVTFSQAKTVRIGVLVDNADSARLSPATLRLRQTTGGSYDTGHLTAGTVASRNRSNDWYFFDVVAQAGDVFEVSGNADATHPETGVGGVVFDSHPSGLPLSGSGAWAWTYSPTDGPLTSTVTITAYDGSLNGTTTFSLNVANVVPTATFAANLATTIENTSTPPSVSFTSPVDPSSADVTAGLRYNYDFNNDGVWDVGSGTYAGGVSSTNQTVPASYFAHPAPPTLTVKGRIIDKDAGFTDYTAVIAITRAVPTLTSVSPGFGSTAGGAPVTLTGTNLTGASAVTFGGTAATTIVVVNANTLTCITPAHAAGYADVSVTTPGGTASRTNGYTYYVGTGGDVAFSNFMDATTVVGQTSFTAVTPTASQTITPGPGLVATSVTGKFAIADSFGSRVLIWNSVPTSNGVPADVVVGQPNFTSTTGGASASHVGVVNGVAFSPDGQKLIAVDATNNRVLIWNTVPTSNGAAADVVIGQTNFTSSTSGATANKFSAPQGVLVTPDGKLLVGDRVNNRVMVYNAIPTTNNAAADVVIGQPNKTSVTSGTGAAQMDRPWAQALAPDGRLLIADEFNHRVLVFASIPTSDGASASVVIGQPGFGSNATATSQTGMTQPIGVAVSPAGRLAVSDYNNHRVLIYNSVPTANGAAADFALGQPNFTSSAAFNGGISAHSISGPSAGMFTADGRLIVPGWGMRRAMIYGTAPFAPTITSIAPTSGVIAGGTSVVITGTNFTGATAVTIGGTAVTSYTVDSATQITATTAAHAAGASSVLVTTAAGTNAANTLFTYIIPNVAPTDIALSPASIAENNAAADTVGTLTATDADSGQTHAFTLVAGNGTDDADNGSFTISGSSLKLTPVANFETKSSYSLRVRATDDGVGSLFYEKALTVTITDVNEAPTNLTLIPSSIAENNAPSATVGTLAATDVDAGQTHTFTLVAGDGTNDADNGSFSITGSSLELTPMANFETKSTYALHVRATDNGAGSLFYEKALTVTITDVNEPPSDITLTPGSIAENNAANATVGTLTATDADAAQTHIFTLVAGAGNTDNSSFTITGTSLKLTPVANYEVKPTYALRVRATDSGTGSLLYEKALTVTITNVNEAPVIPPAQLVYETVTPRRSSGNIIYSVNNSVALTGATFPRVRYRMQTRVDGVLRYADVSFDTWAGLNVAGLRVPTVGSPLVIQRNVANLTVDSNFLGRSNATKVITGGAFDGRLEIWPWDYASTTAAVPSVGGSSSLYDFDDTSVGSADYGSFQVHNISASTKHTVFGWSNHLDTFPDIGFGNQVNGASIHPDWTFSENNSLGATDWKLQIYLDPRPTLVIAENSAAGTSAGTLFSVDPDASDTATYSLVTGAGDADNSSFTINGTQVQSSASFNFETKATYNIRVRVTDTAGSSSESDLIVYVSNVQEAPTALALSGGSVNENAALNTSVGTLSSTDPDEAETFTYTLVSGTGDTHNASFNISGTTLRTSAALDYEAGAARSVLVRTTDSAGLFYERAFTITINNVNEAPVITSNGGAATGSISIAENTTAVTTVTADDVDAGQTKTYTKTGADAALFTLTSGGQLSFTAAPDFEGPHGNTYAVTVTVTDNGTPANLSDSQALTITVTNKNEVPSFVKGGDQRYPTSTTGAQSVPAWATNINDGDSTATQALTFNVSNNNAAIFSSAPVITSGGDLSYTLSGTSGVATVSVTLTDDNTINGNAALTTSPTQTFTITVDPAPNYTVVTSSGTMTVTDQTGNSDALAITQPVVGSILFAASGRTFSINGALNTTGNSGNVSLCGITSLIVNAAEGADIINVGAFSGISFPSLTINGGLGDDTVNMNGDVTFASNVSLDLDLQNDDVTPGIDNVVFAANTNIFTTDTGIITVKVSRSISFGAGSSIDTINGDLTLEANQQAVPTVGAFFGINMNTGGTARSTGTGVVRVLGKAGSTGTNQIGIIMQSASSIRGGTTGTTLVTGIGRNGTGNLHPGIYLAGTNTTITTAGSHLLVTGSSEAGGTALDNTGITMKTPASISTTGAGNLTLSGTGGLASGARNYGVYVEAGCKVTTVNGDISITGTSIGTTDSFQAGIIAFHTSEISSSGTGNISLVGTGSQTATGISPNGVWFVTNAGTVGALVSTNGGTITLDGKGGPTATGNAIEAMLGTTITGGPITLVGDQVVLDTSATPASLNAGTAAVSIRPKTAAFPINLGAADSGTLLGLTDAELDRITCGTLNIGGSTSGQVTVSAAITRAAAANVNFTSSSTTGIAFTSLGSLNANGGDVNLAGGELGVMSQNSTAAVIADDLVLSATGDGEIGGGTRGFRFTANTITTSSDDYQTLGSNGAVTIADNDLNAGYGTVELTLGTWSLTSTGSILSSALIGRDATLTGMGVAKRLTNQGTLTPGAAGPGIITTDILNLWYESSLNIQIGGTSPGSLATNHDQIQVGYDVSLLQGFTPLPALNVTSFSGFVPSVGQTYVIIRNDDTDGVEGHFEGLPEGTVMPNFLGSGLNALITYKGGDGNDVEIITTVPEIGVQDYLLTELVDGSTSYTVPFGTTDVGVGLTRSFKINNTGTGDLLIGAVSFQTGESADFAVTTPPPAVIPAGGNATFAVTFTALGSGARNTVMSIASSDFDENPFDIQIGGVGSNTIGGTWTNPNVPPVTIPPSGSFIATGLNFGTQLGFVPTPNQRYTFIDIQGLPPAGVIGNFNDLPEGGVVAMAFNGVIYYFQADYTGGVDDNDLVLRNFFPTEAAAWKWVSGPSSRNGVGIYGNLGVAAPTNNPGARQGPMNWRAQDGSLWMFGGYGYATAVSNPPRYLSDLWQYDRVQGRWIWRGGMNAPNQYGIYGTQGTEVAANAPGSRHTGTTWTDGEGNLWLFGGFGVGTTPGAAALNDLWRFNMSTGRWTWMKGSDVTNAAATYGALGVADPANTPGARSSATGFYRNGSLWLYGGYNGANSYNDLWRYDIASGNWTWVKGSSTPNQNGVYGEVQQNNSSTTPGARRDATGWVAQDGTLWMFGGLGLDSSETALGDLSDLWKYDPVSNRWTWMKGVKTTGAPGMYGAKDVSHPLNLPGARSAGSGWTTVDGKFWLIGGFKNSMLTFNDVWIFDPTTNEWTWKQGAEGTLSVPGVYGTQGEASASNQPGGRFTPSTWVTLNGTLWIFGGGGADKFGNTGRMSDLWSFGIPNPAQTPSDNEFPAAFPDNLIVNAAPSALNATAGTTAYVPVSGQLAGTDTDGDRIKFSSASATTISQGTLTLNAEGTWTYTPSFGFTGIVSFQFKASDSYGGQSAMKTLVITVSTNPADRDGDGIADEYEQSIWGSLNADADGDADLDGQSNYFEFLAQTNPLDGSERLLTAPTMGAEGHVLKLSHVRPGVNYHLETSSNIKDWNRAGTFTFSVSGSATIEPPAAASGAPVFYRMSLEATPAIIVP